jgi:hypothetical protein
MEKALESLEKKQSKRNNSQIYLVATLNILNSGIENSIISGKNGKKGQIGGQIMGQF